MWGAIIGDLAGSIYEYNQLKKITSIQNDKIIHDNSFYSDDTILTIAILDAILNDKNYEQYLKKYAIEYQNYKPNYNPYFANSFSPNFIKWINDKYQGKSNGNGAMMRISPVGYLFDTEKDVIENAVLATMPSHNTEEAIYCTKIVSLIIFYARKGIPKNEILKMLNISLKYTPFQKFNTTCFETLDNCLYALFTSDNFEESINKIISYGGDTDTNACIVGSMSEVIYGIPNQLIEEAKEKIPDDFVKKIELGYKNIFYIK